MQAEGDIRLTSLKEYVRVQNVICSLEPVKKDALIIVQCILNRPPMSYDDLMDKTFTKARKLAEAEGMEENLPGRLRRRNTVC